MRGDWGMQVSVLAASSKRVGPQRLGLQSMHSRYAWLPPLRQWLRGNGFARLLLLRAGSHVEEWTARISPRELVLLVVGYVVDNVNPPFQGEKRVVFLVILAMAIMVIWQMRNKGLYEGANFSYCDLILFFRHQLRVKIRSDRRRLDRITFSKKWVHAASLVVCKGATLESAFPPLPVHGDDDLGPSGPHPW